MNKRLISVLFATGLAGCAHTPPSFQSQFEQQKPMGSGELSTSLAAADATREEGHFSEALQIYQQLMVDAPSEPRAQYGVGECLLALGKPSEAKQIFIGLKINPDLHAAALQGEGLALLALGQKEAAATALREASTANPALWRSWNALGNLADLRHQPDEAAKLYAKASEINPDSAAIINNSGYSKLISGDAPHAIDLFHTALSLDPKSETIQNNLRLAIAVNGNYADAIKAASHEQLPIVLNNVGYVAMQHGDYATAEGYFARAMEASSSYASVTAKNLEQLKAEHPSSQ
jgi:Flp pilus assembly protein TadD